MADELRMFLAGVMGTAAEGKRIRIRGTVQGVGFRPWVYRVALETGIRGRVRNDSSGVTIDAFGDEDALEEFEQALHVSPPPAARIAEFDTVSIPSESVASFVIEHSTPSAQRHVSIPPDLATCPACVNDILDPANRRYRYAFTNCTNCGPRFTIATDAPYDRSSTTMAPFEMCDLCRREYRGRTRPSLPRTAHGVSHVRAEARRDPANAERRRV